MKRKDLVSLAAATLLFTACFEDASDKGTVWNVGKDNSIGFDVNIEQDWYGEQPRMRTIMEQSVPRNIQMTSTDGMKAWLQETTLSGIQERPEAIVENVVTDEATTRGTMIGEDKKGMSAFSSFCFKGDGSEFYSNVKVSKDGSLAEDKKWEYPELAFYAIHPYSADNATAFDSSAKTYDFTVDSNVENEVDLMYASTGALKNPGGGLAPIHFKHALTSISFAFGSNPDFLKTISSITLGNIYTSGTYTLPTDDNANGFWTTTGSKGSVTLSGLSVAANMSAANSAITGSTQNFLMIPQDLNGVTITINFSDNTSTTVTLTEGSWEEGTTKVYNVSAKEESWTYQLAVSNPADMSYKEKTSSAYTITSYRYIAGGTKQQAIPWEVVKYEYFDDNINDWVDNGMTKPEWLTSLSLGENGEGSTSAASGTATVDADRYIVDLKAERDNTLKNAAKKSNYDLSQGGETANCYLISAPGTYRIPLIYGNMRNADGTTNTACVGGDNAALNATFMDALGTNLYAQGKKEIQGVNASTTPALVWKDVDTDIITNLNVDVANNFLTFEVTKEAIKQGNAVVGIKNGDDYLWSWHLWFAPADALSTVAVTNSESQLQNFTKENLGFVYDTWEGSSYQTPRKARVTIRQVYGDANGPLEAQLVITQNNGSVCTFHDTKYQFGRKDAFNGSIASSVESLDGPVDYDATIKNPQTFYKTATNKSWCSKSYTNPWSVNSTGKGVANTTAEVVKTVYDPCPAGFKMPGSNAFSSFKKDNGVIRVSGDWGETNMGGYDFPANDGSSIFIPASGMRSYTTALSVKTGAIWTAIISNGNTNSQYLSIAKNSVAMSAYQRSTGFSVRPVKN